jgi:1-phosphatidylinositol-3-phosphate 5-kinase
MSRSKIWDAKGGKSRSWFSKTLDDRWILKGIAAVELESFLQFAPQYFDYLSKVYFQQVPTALAKIVGVYSVIYKRGNKSLKQDFLVMENLFYKRSISKVISLHRFKAFF